MKYIFRSAITVILLQLTIAAQYEVRVINQSLMPEGYFFDVAIKAAYDDFLMGSYQCIFDFNNEFSLQPLSFEYIEGTSQLTNKPIVNTGIQSDDSILKLCFAGGAGEDLVTSEYIKIGSFVVRGSFPSKEDLDINWSFSGNINTIIADETFNDITTPQTHLVEEVALPVELVSFNAEYKNANITLNWETATELNSYGFQVERRREEEIDFISLDLVKSLGGSAGYKYNWTDKNNLLPGKYIYRLKQLDTDGSFEYLPSIEVVVNRPMAYKLYQNFPNPFNPSTSIKYSLKENSRVELNIYDIRGKLIDIISDNIQESGNHSFEWAAGNYASGIYICQLRAISVESGELYSSIIKMILLK